MLAHEFIRKDDRSFKPTASSKSAWYFLVLVLSKLLKCIGVFFMDILLKSSHVVSLLWFYKIGTAAFMMPVQKPFSHGKTIRKPLLLRIARLSLVNCLIEVAWLYGITLCGPLRSILVFELSPAVVLAAAMAVIKGAGSAAKSRGIACLAVGLISLLLMDKDHNIEDIHTRTHAHHAGLNHVFYHVVSLFGVADHQGGVLLLLLTLLIRIPYETSFRHLALDLGGQKRLHSLVSLVSAAILTPLAVLVSMTSSSESLAVISFWSFAGLLLAAAAFFILDFYAESVCFQHVADPVMSSARWSSVTMFCSALLLAWIWYPAGPTGHPISGGVVVTVAAFSLAAISLTAPAAPKHSAGHFVGISDDGMPLYTYGEAFLQRTGRSALHFVKETLRDILSNTESRKIFWFLCVNLAFCGVEFMYGFWTNSLGLISDGFHMLFDCSALVMGLVASVMSRWPATRPFSYGYGRVEVLSGFINALFLNVIAMFILIEASSRIWDPPKINTDRLLVVGTAGLLVNLFGLYSLHSDDGHGHSHHGHSHAHGHSHGGNANMQGVFLHVLADTLGSVFVIISTLCLTWFGWQWCDPVCSLILSLLILGSAYPLLKSAAFTLLQNVPDEMEGEFEHALQDALEVEGVESYSDAHLWQLKGDLNVASVHIQATAEANAQLIRHKVVALLKAAGATQSSVQVEKASFHARIRQLCPNYGSGERTTKANCIPRERKANGHGHSHDGGGHGHSHDSHDNHGHSHDGGHGHSHGGASDCHDSHGHSH